MTETQLIKDYHRIEKGLALPRPKLPFGAVVQARLETQIEAAKDTGVDPRHISDAETALVALRQWNAGGPIDDVIAPVLPMDIKSSLENPEKFFLSRESCRNFASKTPSDAVLDRAVSLAQSTPSVCNRQSWRVRFYSGEDAADVLQFQSGNTGFTGNVPVTALITVDSLLFAGPGERNQAWVEGGLFSMSLGWGFHSLGLASCMLNMSVTNDVAERLRSWADIADSELIIMMMAVGYPAPGARGARSPRRPLEQVRRR